MALRIRNPSLRKSMAPWQLWGEAISPAPSWMASHSLHRLGFSCQGMLAESADVAMPFAGMGLPWLTKTGWAASLLQVCVGAGRIYT